MVLPEFSASKKGPAGGLLEDGKVFPADEIPDLSLFILISSFLYIMQILSDSNIMNEKVLHTAISRMRPAHEHFGSKVAPIQAFITPVSIM